MPDEKPTPTLNFDSPKAAPTVLAIGSAIWKLIAWWANVDFVLSVREEKVAVMLQLILDWGWLIFVIVGIFWFLGANRMPQDTSKVHWGMVASVGVLTFMAGVLVSVYATGSLPNLLIGWGGDSTSKTCSANVDTSRLVDLKDKNRILLVCGIADASQDAMEDTRIAISRPFTITGQTVSITTLYGGLTAAAQQFPQNVGFMIWHSVASLPTDVDVSEIKHISDIPKRGGRILSVPAVNAFANPAMGLGPIVSVPAPKIN